MTAWFGEDVKTIGDAVASYLATTAKTRWGDDPEALIAIRLAFYDFLGFYSGKDGGVLHRMPMTKQVAGKCDDCHEVIWHDGDIVFADEQMTVTVHKECYFLREWRKEPSEVTAFCTPSVVACETCVKGSPSVVEQVSCEGFTCEVCGVGFGNRAEG